MNARSRGAIRIGNRASLVALLSLSSCGANQAALQYGASPKTPVEQIREAETQPVSCRDAAQVTRNAAVVLQKMGMTIEANDPSYGVVSGSSQRDARDAGQIATAVAVGVLIGAANVHFDMSETLRATVIVSPPRLNQCSVRLGFERLLLDNKGAAIGGILVDPEISAGFFTLLARAPA